MVRPIPKTEPLAVYLHWPYCARICPYCDFNVHLNRRAGEGDALVQAMVADLEYWRDWTGPRSIGSIHFGGGTPSLLGGEQLSTLIQTVERLWGFDDVEVAIEANPNDVTQDRLEAWSQAGLTRLSLGVQSFDDAVLKRLGRDHDGASARWAVEAALAALPSVSVDLIFGVLGEEAGRLQSDLQTLLDLGVPHISTYQLTIEPDTAFARAEARGDIKAVDEEASATGFDLIQVTLGTQGYHHYEVSNFAKPGHESRHNLAYWQGQDYVGVGPGAHGRLWTDGGRVATETALRPADYIAQVDATGSGLTEQDTLSPEAAAEEYVLMGLRIEDGLSLGKVAAIRGRPLSIDPDLIEAGWFSVEGDHLRATSKGRMVLDALTRALLV